MQRKLFIPIILGTNREGRQSENVAKLLVKKMKSRKDLEIQLFNVGYFKFPQDDYGQAVKGLFPEWRDAMSKADGLVIVTPEYNHGYPGPLKAALDLLLPEYRHKAVGLVGVSAGPWGGARVIENMIPVMRELGLVVISADLNFPSVQNTFGPKGELKDEAYLEGINGFLDELEWMAQTLRWGRDNIVSK